MDLVKAAFLGTNPTSDGRELIGVKSIQPDRVADKNFKGPFYTLSHVRDRLKRDTGVLERGLGSVGGVILNRHAAKLRLSWAILYQNRSKHFFSIAR